MSQREIPDEAVEAAVPYLEDIVRQVINDGLSGRNANEDCEAVLQAALPALEADLREQLEAEVRERLEGDEVRNAVWKAIRAKGRTRKHHTPEPSNPTVSAYTDAALEALARTLSATDAAFPPSPKEEQ